MALYNRGSLPANASMSSPEFKRASLLHYQADLEPVRRQAQDELQQEFGGRGLAQSGGQAIAARLANRQNFIQQIAQKDQGLGVQQADLGEQNRQRLEGRGWQLQDIAAQQGLEDEFQKWQAEDYANYRRALPMKKLFGGIGKLAGAGTVAAFNSGGYGSGLNAPAEGPAGPGSGHGGQNRVAY